jgi:oligoribonuclease
MIRIFLDYETTGLAAQQEIILEVAMVAVDIPSFTAVDEFSTVIRPEGGADGVRLLCNEFVWNMHERSGLIDVIRADEKAGRPSLRNGGLPSNGEAQQACIAFVNKHVPGLDQNRGELCGANPSFDRDFMREHMPDLWRRFHYRNFDINSLHLLQRWVSGQPTDKGAQAHRALADCHEAIACVHAHFNFMARLFAPQRQAQLDADWAKRDALAAIP